MERDLRRILLEQPWELYIKRLTVFAEFMIRNRGWRGEEGGPVPGGKEAADFAMEAILCVFDGRRNWDPDHHPDLLAHLRWVIKSEISNAVTKAENTSEIRITEETEVPGQDADNLFFDALFGAIGEEPELIALVECIQDGCQKPADMAAHLGVTVQEVQNRKKRLRRRMEALMEKEREA